jgi:hypothetical protein
VAEPHDRKQVRFMRIHGDEELIPAYIQYEHTQDEKLFWAWDEVMNIVLGYPEDAWRLLLRQARRRLR